MKLNMSRLMKCCRRYLLSLIVLPLGSWALDYRTSLPTTDLGTISLPATIRGTLTSNAAKNVVIFEPYYSGSYWISLYPCKGPDTIYQASIQEDGYFNYANLSSSSWLYTFTEGRKYVIEVSSLWCSTESEYLIDIGWSSDDDVWVRFDGNGGTPSSSSKYYDVGGTYGYLPTAEWEGHTFDGWYTERVGGIKIRSSSTVCLDYERLYAHWDYADLLYLIVDFYSNGGTGKMVSQVFLNGYSMPLEPNSFVREGYDFVGWSSTGDGEVEFTDCEMVTPTVVVVGEHVPLYAVWRSSAEEASCRVVFNANGGECSQAMKEVRMGSPIGDIPVPERTGYGFCGWYTLPTDDGIMVQENTVVDADVTWYAHWSPVRYTITYGNVKDDSNHNPLEYTVEDDFTFTSLSDAVGYRFVGWSREGIARGTTGDLTITASYEPIRYSITYGNMHGSANGNPETYTIEDSIVFAEPDKVKGWKFAGWSPTGILQGTVGNLTVMANWIERTVPQIAADNEAPLNATVANTYDGIAIDENGVLLGMVSVKVAKKGKNGEAKVTATVQFADEAKKVTFKGGIVDGSGKVTGLSAAGHTMNLSLGKNGMRGLLDGITVDGARNVFNGRSIADKTVAAAAAKSYQGVYNIVLDKGTISISVDKKGKVKTSGTINGIKVSTTSQLLVGEDVAMIPVVVTKKVNLAFGVWLDDKITVSGLEVEAVGKADSLVGNAKFCIGDEGKENLLAVLPGLYVDYIPQLIDVGQSGVKWIVANQAKMGKLILGDSETGALDHEKSRITSNTSGLKLTYKAKNGSFKGSFKVYAFEKGKIKSYVVNVTGVMVGNVGYGSATIKKPYCSFPVGIR